METPPLGSIGIGQLIARIDRSWDMRGAVREKIRQRLPEMKARAKRTNEFLVGLLAAWPPITRVP